jgi:hypothetical protein
MNAANPIALAWSDRPLMVMPRPLDRTSFASGSIAPALCKETRGHTTCLSPDMRRRPTSIVLALGVATLVGCECRELTAKLPDLEHAIQSIVGLIQATNTKVDALGGKVDAIAEDLADCCTRTPISKLPFDIKQCGSYYLTRCLQGDLNGPGIRILANDVTPDLNGFTISGPPGGGPSGPPAIGAYANGIRIHNGAIRGWSGHGIQGGSALQVEDVHLIGNAGSGLQDYDQCTIVHVIAERNGAHGIAVGSGSRVEACEAIGNHGDGIRASTGSLVLRNSAMGNYAMGVHIALASSPSVLEGSRIEQNHTFMNHHGGIVVDATATSWSGTARAATAAPATPSRPVTTSGRSVPPRRRRVRGRTSSTERPARSPIPRRHPPRGDARILPPRALLLRPAPGSTSCSPFRSGVAIDTDRRRRCTHAFPDVDFARGRPRLGTERFRPRRDDVQHHRARRRSRSPAGRPQLRWCVRGGRPR